MQFQSLSETIQDFTVGGDVTTNGDPFARKTVSPDVTRYFVSYLTYGQDSGRMRNHISGTQENAMNNGLVRHLGRNRYELREVSEDSFNSYLDFLKRGDEKALRNAERIAR